MFSLHKSLGLGPLITKHTLPVIPFKKAQPLKGLLASSVTLDWSEISCSLWNKTWLFENTHTISDKGHSCSDHLWVCFLNKSRI